MIIPKNCVLMAVLSMVYGLLLISPGIALAADASAQRGVIEFPLEVDADANGQLRWILLPPASEAQIQIDANAIRSILYDTARDLITSKLSRSVQQKTPLDFAHVFNAFAHAFTTSLSQQNLKASLGKVLLKPYLSVRDPARQGTKATLTAPIRVVVVGTPLASLHLILAFGVPNAAAYDAATLGPLKTVAAANGLVSLDLTPEEGATVVSVVNSIDLTPDEIRRLTPQLIQIAYETLRSAASHGLTFGKRPPTLPQLDAALDQRFRPPRATPVSLFIEPSPTPKFSHHLTLGFLKVVRQMVIEPPREANRLSASEMLRDIQATLPQVWTSDLDQALREKLSMTDQSFSQLQLHKGQYVLRLK